MSHEVIVAEVKGDIYRFLSNIYIDVPDSNFPDVLNEQILPFLLSIKSFARKEKWPRGIDEGISLMEKYVESIGGKEVTESLAVEFTRLFRGVKPGYGPPPPYESVYKKSEHVMSEATSEVLEKYRKSGLTVARELEGEPPDHISFELYFLSYLCNREAESLRTNDENRAYEYRAQKNEFLQEHVIKWVPSFCERILKESKNDFYKGAAKLTKEFVVLDFNEFNSI